MRMTIDVPDHLFRRTKDEAVRRGLRLDDLVRDALERLLQAAEGPSETPGQPGLEEQRLGPNCVLPLVTGPLGPLMPTLVGGEAQRLLDREDVERYAKGLLEPEDAEPR